MRILGLDLGSSSVKAVELDSAFGRFEVHEYHELKVEAGRTPFETARALLDGLAKAPDRIVVAVPTAKTTFRNLQLPTRDRKAIQSGVGFELEDEIPFPIEDTHYDHCVIEQQGQVSRIHVAAMLKEPFRAFLSQLIAAGIDPDVVTTEAWALRALASRALESDAGPTLIADLGRERAVLYIHHKGQPVVAREVPIGGRDLTLAIAQKYGIAEDQAESAKLVNGFVLPSSGREGATQEQVDFSDTLMGPVDELIREIRHSNLVCKSATHQILASIRVCGGSSLLPGLTRLIEEESRIPVQPLTSLSSVAAPGVTYSETTDSGFALPAGLALCLVGPDRNRLINLRKGAFAKRGGTARVIQLDNLRGPLIYASIVVASLFVSLAVQSQVYQSRLSKMDEQLQRSVKSFFATASPSAIKTYLSSPSTLRKQVRAELDKSREIARLAGPNPKSPLGFLKELSSAVNREVTVDLLKFQAGASPSKSYEAGADEDATLTFALQNQEQLDRLKAMVERRIPGVTLEKTEEFKAPDGTKRIQVTLKGRPAEEAYGK